VVVEVKMKLAIFLLFGTLFLISCSAGAQQITGDAICDLDTACSGDFIIPLDKVSDQMTKFTYSSKGVDVVFFAVKDKDNEIRTAFDACDVCRGYKGYTQKGHDVMCEKCGRFFDIQDIGTKNHGGGCWPSFLNHEIQGDEILIKTSDLDKGAFRFA